MGTIHLLLGKLETASPISSIVVAHSASRIYHYAYFNVYLVWGIIRNNSSFILKGNKQTYSREPNNLKSRNSFRYNGLIHKRTVGVENAKDNKGIVLITRKPRSITFDQPAQIDLNRVELKKGGRKSLSTIRNTIRKGRYRKDLKMAALRRASALLKSQKPVAVRKTMRKKKE
ncbi:60S ribosomal protein L28-like [Dreissena polymorpha]|uniref:60S ribosomal protein L28-like n=1 Tax=Dreissena polymorpha TaxID=45954 RepID=UPI002265390A|nr:60S ribosomal protein L28-like [Dreissena polymorpha]